MNSTDENLHSLPRDNDISYALLKAELHRSEIAPSSTSMRRISCDTPRISTTGTTPPIIIGNYIKPCSASGLAGSGLSVAPKSTMRAIICRTPPSHHRNRWIGSYTDTSLLVVVAGPTGVERVGKGRTGGLDAGPHWPRPRPANRAPE